MLLSVNTIVHLYIKVQLEEVTINSLAEWAFARRAELMRMLLEPLVELAQKEWLDRVEAGAAEMVCTACGVVHQGGKSWVRRGSRPRTVKTSSGEIELALVQVTCRECGKTRAPCMEGLGMEPRRQCTRELTRKLVERVYDTSYHKSVQTARDCMGVGVAASTLHRLVQESAARVELTPDPECEVVMADGTPVRAGERMRSGTRVEHEELRLAVQLIGRTDEDTDRPKAQLRLIGLGVGLRTWPVVLPGDTRTKLIVTDAEPALVPHVRDQYPQARHQMCEWHIAHTLDWPLRKDGVGLKQRRRLQDELHSIIWGKRSQAEKRALYDAFIERLSCSPSAQYQLRQAASRILYDEPSSETTTSLIERQMREVDRRAEIGARWSTRGIRNLMLLRMCRTHNVADYARVWMC
ncbi:ISH6 family transposase [Longimicrobium sp.]|jgi:hypothetical protein|uniref:ISH6 family transposase n=1 Tax=Longimicrobium sp. TaxID=2029185 RepID=UPI002F952D61